MASNDIQLKAVVTAEDKTKSGFQSVESGSKSLASTFKNLAVVAGGLFATKQIVDWGAEAVKGFADAEASAIRVNTTLETMVGRTIEISTGLTQTISSLKLSSSEMADFKNKVEAAGLAIQAKQDQLVKLRTQLNAGKITQDDFNLSTKMVKNQIDALNITISQYNSKMGETETSVVNLTKKHQITREEIEKAKEKIKELGDAAVKLGFDDEAAAESVTRFYQATGDLTKAQELNSLAMDLARAKSIDLATATGLVNMVLSGNGRALKQYQINIKDTASPLEALGQLHDQVKGQAEAFANTTQGRLDTLSESYSNLRDSVGGLLSEALVPLLNALIPVVTTLSEMDLSTKALSDGLREISKWIETNTGLISYLQQAWVQIVDLFNISLLPAFQELWSKHGVLITELAKNLAYVLGVLVVGAIYGVVGSIQVLVSLLTVLLTGLTVIVNYILTKWQNTFNAFIDGWNTAKKVIDAVVTSIEKVISATARVSSSVGSAIGSAVGTITGKRADGGPVSGGSSYLVGERGPEIFTPSISGIISPNGSLAGAGNITINITGNSFLDDGAADKMAETLMRTIKRQLRI